MMNRFILILLSMAILAGIWTIYWSAKAYFTPEATAFGCATVSPPVITPTDSLTLVGETLFKNNCSACHMTNRVLIGPALSGISKKYASNKEWLYEWVKNSPSLIEEGDPLATELFKKYNQVPMTAFPLLTNEEIDAILAFADFEGDYYRNGIP